MILAAGASERMGTPKALLPWGNGTLLDYALAQAAAADIADIVVVLGPATRDVHVPVRSVYNPEPTTGRSASIRLAAAALPDDLSAIVVQSVDQPVPSYVLLALLVAVAPREGGAAVDIAVPTFGGRRGHPVCFAGRLLPELHTLKEESEGLRAVVRAHAVLEVPVDDEAVVWNLNDPAAYQAARARA